jgi:4-amino-4-deoxy-L-arabinose transferase-like glycosyltransferase
MKQDRPKKPAKPPQARRPSRATIVIGLFVIAVGLRGFNVWRPVDGSIWNASREANVAAIARNFYREGMNILYPRIDWRGAGPGFVESEFPLLPWLGANLYHLLGYHEEILRLLAFSAAAATCFVFWRLADRVMGGWPAVVAFGFFAAHPLLVASASWIQPESMLLLAYLLAIDYFDRWTDAGGWPRYLTAWLATTLAILIKLSAAHLGLLFVLMSVRKFGLGAVRRIDLWLLAVLCLVPSLLWYAHARSLWIEYDNSLGISNDALVYIWSFDFLRALPIVVVGVLYIEAVFVWAPPGLLFALPAVRSMWRLEASFPATKTGPGKTSSNGTRVEFHALMVEWALALAVCFIVTGRTTGELWGYYYHIVSVPLVALAVGMSCGLLFAAARALSLEPPMFRTQVHQMWLAVAVIAAIYAVLGWSARTLAGDSWRLLAASSLIGLASGGVLLYLGRWARHRVTEPLLPSLPFRVWLVGLLMGASLEVGWNVAEIRRYFQGKPEIFAKYEAALQFAPHLDGGLIGATGHAIRDAYGLPRAGTATYFFYWLDRKGFAVGADDLRVETLEELRKRGVRFFIAEQEVLSEVPLVEGALRRRFHVVEDHSMAVLFDLTRTERNESNPQQDGVLESTLPRDA